MLKFFPVMKGYTFEDKALTSQENCGSIYYRSKLLRVFKGFVIFSLTLIFYL